MSTRDKNQNSRHKVVVVGSGFGGINAAKSLKKADVDVTLISATSHHLFQPLLYQVATGILSEGEIAPLNRVILRKVPNTRVVLGKVTHIDIKSKVVTTELEGKTFTYPYDSLVLASGSTQSYFGNDQFAQFAPGLKSLDDALEIRSRLIEAFERAEAETDPVEKEKLLTFVVVGAGPTGVEITGQIAELADRTLRKTFDTVSHKDVKIILVDGADRVIPNMSQKSSATSLKNLTSLGIDIRLSAMVVDITQDSITYKLKDGSQTTIDAYFKVWSAGVASSPLGKLIAEQAGVETDRAGRVIVEPDLSVKGYPEVFVVGDLMHVEGVPGMAQGAIQGARYAAKAIISSLNGVSHKERVPFKYRDKGSMATISRHKAVAQMGKINFSGYLAWLMWLVVHLFFLVGFKNRMFAVLSWLISFSSSSRGQLSSTLLQVKARNAFNKLKEEKPST